MSSFDLAVIALCSVAGFTLQGAVGYGMGILGTPILILIDPRLVPGPVLASTMVFTLMVTVRERRGIDLGGVGWALAGRVAGTLPAAAVLAVLPQNQLSRVFGLMVLLAVAISVSGVHVRPRPSTLVAGGVLSGLMGTVAAIGGPPIALLYQHASGEKFRGTLSSLFFVGTIISIAALVPAGRFGGPELRLSLFMLPGAVFGFLASRRLASRLDRGYTRPAVLGVAAVAGCIVVVRSFVAP